ncbi:hypothetical protein A3C59_00040 [Candidatus Daviesbacteria bacterium RIFCSPHIGHO2_02_FULL_36_13]|uniref:Uncharacterized protein n=1 Tax=Candidatus Daviesbacteria bacterium RIFCSPHIGHO2_02_FULL_36_13 TaxID=1797768 RepID=A0A1F5JYB7_9BACT|nr:MAG: hypothetical protein A3C59_00040 [Candidatus Daviesbacteria bacterium RIFCSPHIGHO2_02_FULL_36_13]OGE40882.1 MAG: hypothetical protein A3A45_01365 [Candidatus Daviesbacteria bacterium RIFCSPLOWO2_01_FULL_36_8]
MATLTEAFPAGNEWHLSEKNYKFELRPGRGVEEILPASGRLAEIVQNIQGRFIREDWQFASLLQVSQRADDSPHLVAVFTHPARNISVEERKGDIGQFVKVDASIENYEFFNWGFPAEDPINQILKGTNRAGAGIMAGYNAVEIYENRYFWQPGVGYFDMRFPTVEEHISWENESIEELMVRVRPHLERRATLEALQVSNPRQLFQ